MAAMLVGGRRSGPRPKPASPSCAPSWRTGIAVVDPGRPCCCARLRAILPAGPRRYAWRRWLRACLPIAASDLASARPSASSTSSCSACSLRPPRSGSTSPRPGSSNSWSSCISPPPPPRRSASPPPMRPGTAARLCRGWSPTAGAPDPGGHRRDRRSPSSRPRPCCSACSAPNSGTACPSSPSSSPAASPRAPSVRARTFSTCWAASASPPASPLACWVLAGGLCFVAGPGARGDRARRRHGARDRGASRRHGLGGARGARSGHAGPDRSVREMGSMSAAHARRIAPAYTHAITTLASLGREAAAWDDLSARAGDAHPFFGRHVMQAHLASGLASSDLRVVVVRGPERLEAVLPFRRSYDICGLGRSVPLPFVSPFITASAPLVAEGPEQARDSGRPGGGPCRRFRRAGMALAAALGRGGAGPGPARRDGGGRVGSRRGGAVRPSGPR